MGVCDLLQSEKLDSDLSIDLINGLSKSATALDTVLRDLNYILQVKREVNELHAELFFSEIVDQIKLSISNLIIQENASIVTDFSEINKFSTIKTYLYSIFYNLILNSLKYKKPHVDPIIEIKSSLQADSFTLFFKDNGLGIDLEKKGDQLFMLYKRFHFHIEGKGMGLFMVKSQVETLGGKIFVSSEVGKGTEFRIVFDLKNHH
jgi:light-regulated signal transduction histidine kinase (bacteriophytochrome)